MNKKEKKIFEGAISAFGNDEQIRVAQEECAELIKALSKYHRVITYQNKDKRKVQRCLNNILEEMADVSIMLDQLQLIFGFTKTELEEVRTMKIERLEERIPWEEE